MQSVVASEEYASKESDHRCQKCRTVKTSAALDTFGFQTIKISGQLRNTGESIIFECETPVRFIDLGFAT